MNDGDVVISYGARKDIAACSTRRIERTHEDLARCLESLRSEHEDPTAWAVLSEFAECEHPKDSGKHSGRRRKNLWRRPHVTCRRSLRPRRRAACPPGE